jgi:uncharacterized protein YjbI with pentapeptide repeats
MTTLLDLLKDRNTWNTYREKTKHQTVEIFGISFNGDDLSGYDFMFVTFTRCTFIQTTLHETNFRHAHLIDCDLTDAKYWKTMLEGVDVSTCRMNDFPTNCYTEGTIVSARQRALIMAKLRRLSQVEEKSITEEMAGV